MAASRRSTRVVAIAVPSPAWIGRQDEPDRERRQSSSLLLPVDQPVAVPREQGHAGGRSRSGSGAMRVRAVLLAAALVLAPLGTRAADLVVWWEEGYHPREDQAVRELVAAFELKTGKR